MDRLVLPTLKRIFCFMPKDSDFEKRPLHPMITEDRDTGNGYYISRRDYPSGDAEIVALKLDSDDSLRRGGGAKRKNTEKKAMCEITLNKSVNRAKVNIRRKVLSMSADRLLTLTFRENVTDLDEAWGCLKYFTKLMRERFNNDEKQFTYVCVPEYQKRGAVHFHLAISGYYPVVIVRALWLRATGTRKGNIDITSPKRAKKNAWNPKHIANYIAKYISKSDDVGFNSRRYSTGGSIEVPPPQTGWLARGLPVIAIMRESLELVTRKNVDSVWESDGYFHITYLST